MRKINKAGLDLIKSFEGLYLTAYLDIVGVPTIGFGCTEGVSKEDVANKRTISAETAESMLMTELDRFQKGVEACVTVPLNDNEFAALVSFSYNLGLGSLQKSTLLKLLLSGDRAGAAEQFIRWNKAGGKEVSGLTRRRLAEKALFLSPVSSGSGGNLLPDGPSDEEISIKLEEIEKEATRMK
jgi:lysozyme